MGFIIFEKKIYHVSNEDAKWLISQGRTVDI